MNKTAFKMAARITALTVALTLFLSVRELNAQVTAKGGGTKLLELSGINTPAQAEALKPGDAIAMACAKCKSVQVTYVTTESKEHVKKLIPGEKHLCPGCQSTIEVVGHGKAKHDVVKHVCAKCGDASAFCCATKAGTGPTPGMTDKEKK